MSEKKEKRLQLYLEDSREQLDGIENDILLLEKLGSEAETDLVNRIFRRVHSVKGGAGFLGLKSIKDLSHATEDVLNEIRNNGYVPSNEDINTLLSATDYLKTMLNNPAKSEKFDISQPLEGLQHILANTSVTEKTIKNNALQTGPSEHSNAFSITQEDLTNFIEGGFNFYFLTYDLADLEIRGKTKEGIAKELDEIGYLIDAIIVESDVKPQPYLLLMATVLSEELTVRYLEILPSQLELLSIDQENFVQSQVVRYLPEEHEIQASPLAVEELPLAPTSEAAETATDENNLEQDSESTLSSIPPSEEEGDSSPTLVTTKTSTLAATSLTNPSKEVTPVETSTASQSSSSYINQKKAEKQENTPVSKSVSGVDKKENLSSTIRVNVNILDSLMNLAGELVLTRNQLNQTVSIWDKYAIEGAAQRLDTVTSELQETIMSTRMQPIGIVFDKFQRVVRDMSKKMGKLIDFTVSGEDVELDKTIIENIGDPLTHLVRNAIDHGLEIPEERKKTGKHEIGKLHLTAKHEAGHVVIEIIDDGAGIDAAKIKDKALEKGVVDKTKLDEMSEKEIVKLIFTPGFSTAKKVSDISGRGVGMDVVLTNLTQLGGTIDIDTQVGQGTNFKIKLPLTLAIIPSLLVQVNKENFAIPQVNLVELVRIPPSQVNKRLEKVGDSLVIRLRGNLLPLIRLQSFLGIQESAITHPVTQEELPDRRKRVVDRRSELQSSIYAKPREGKERRFRSASSVNIVVVSAGETRYGIIVDTLMDSEEIVVKPLGYHLRECVGYAGATILGDGSAALILDVAGVAKFMHLSHQKHLEREQEKRLKKAQRAVGDPQNLLILENAPNEQFAVQLAFIHRIERIQSTQIQQVGNKTVTQYRGGALLLFALEDTIEVKPRAEGKYVYLIIFSMHDREVAIMASSVVDIVSVNIEVDRVTFQQPGVIGSAIIMDRITLLLDVFGIAKKQVPKWAESESLIMESGTSKTILMVEDTPFFREHIREILEEQGLTVIGANDGEEGLEKLYENKDKIDLILSDVEMPNLDGVEMTKQIRSDPQFNHIKIVILTSLSSEDDVARAEEAGADKYLVKIDQELLIKTTRDCLME